MAREALITQEGLEKLKAEIEHLSTVKRREVAERIKEAREFGDIAENSEYDDAKNEQALLEQRIAQLEERLRRANVVDQKQIDTEKVGVGVQVHVKDQKSGESQQVPDRRRRPRRARPSRSSPTSRRSARRSDRPQARRRRHGRRPARAEEEAQDHQDRSRLGFDRDLGSPRWQSRTRARGARRVRRCSPSGARSSSACAPPGSSRSRTTSTGAPRSPRSAPRTRASRDGEETEQPYRVAGRIAARRGQGKAAFIDLVDAQRAGSSSTSRADVARRGALRPRSSALDLGDIVGVDGHRVQDPPRRALARVTGWTLLAKSLRPPPDKFHGLEDAEPRYRHRELDLIANPEARELFRKRGRTIAEIRSRLDDDGFVEVETPVLQPLYGGALARPVHHPPQRARPRPLPADRDRALPQALRRRRHRARLRARQGLPQRGDLVQAQPRVHDARVVRGLRRLRGRRRAAREARRRTSPRRSTARPRSSATGSRSTSRRRGGG